MQSSEFDFRVEFLIGTVIPFLFAESRFDFPLRSLRVLSDVSSEAKPLRSLQLFLNSRPSGQLVAERHAEWKYAVAHHKCRVAARLAELGSSPTVLVRLESLRSRHECAAAH